jgi:F0F1-type ATP synthase gamma subunit
MQTPGVDVKKNVIVAITSDKGLCGGINSTSVKVSKALLKMTSGNLVHDFCHHLSGSYSKQLLIYLIIRSRERNQVCHIGRKGESSTHS